MRRYPPDYLSLASLAYRLELKCGDVTKLVAEGAIPNPVLLAGKERWWWPAIEDAISCRFEGEALGTVVDEERDPFIRALKRAPGGGR